MMRVSRKFAMSQKVFERKYTSVPHRGSTTRQYSEVTAKDCHYVWSVVAGNNNRTYLVPGYHVNVIGYVQTKHPWADEDDGAGLQVKGFTTDRTVGA